MTHRTYIKAILLIGLIVISIGGIILHIRIHPIAKNASNVIPVISCILGIGIVPLLFLFRKTIAYGYTLNGLLVIIGTITMSHFAIANWPEPTTLGAILFKTTFPDIIILWGKLFVGKTLYDLEFYGDDLNQIKKGKTYRYPNLGWWFIHLVAISFIYGLGNLIWR